MGSARAQVVGADGENGADCFTNGCVGGTGTDGESVTAGGTAIGGAGGKSFGFPNGDGGNGGNGGAASASGTNATAFGGAAGAAGDFLVNGNPGNAGTGGDATAASSALSSGSSNATSAATANGGAGGDGIFDGTGVLGSGAGGNAIATSGATANGSGNAISSATATAGAGGIGFSQAGNATATSSAKANGSGGATASATAIEVFNEGFGEAAANATSNTETAEGGLAQAQAQAEADFGGVSQSTAKTTFGGVSVRSTVESLGGGSTNATAQGGSGQSPVNPGQSAFVFSTALPNTAYATTLIGSATNVADVLLGPDDKIFGTAILGGGGSTFDFNFRGDLILGVVTGGFFSIVANGADILSEDIGDNSVINLGSSLGPNIELTIEGEGVFALGGAVPEPSTWAMMLVGFAGLGFLGYRSTSGGRCSSRALNDP